MLAGDIGNPAEPHFRAHLEQASREFKSVYFVAGNHERWGGSEMSTKPYDPARSWPTCRTSTSSTATAWDVPGTILTILGCTLWSHVPDAARDDIHRSIGDYGAIQRDESLDFVDPELVTQWHERDRSWLEVELSKLLTVNRHVVVMTHHLPSLSPHCRAVPRTAR